MESITVTGAKPSHDHSLPPTFLSTDRSVVALTLITDTLTVGTQHPLFDHCDCQDTSNPVGPTTLPCSVTTNTIRPWVGIGLSMDNMIRGSLW